MKIIKNLITGSKLCRRHGVKFNNIESLLGGVLGCCYGNKTITVDIWSEHFMAILLHEIGHLKHPDGWSVKSKKLISVNNLSLGGESVACNLIREVQASRFAAKVLKAMGDETSIDFLCEAYSTYCTYSLGVSYEMVLNLSDLNYRGVQCIKGKIGFKDFLGEDI